MRFPLLTACTLVAAASAVNAADSAKPRFIQDRFAIGFWVGPPAGQEDEARCAQIAKANFTLVVGGFGSNKPEAITQQLALCEKYDLKALVFSRDIPADKLATGPACWGYMLKDEPLVAEFPPLAARVAEIRKTRPGKLAYINLFPNIATATQLGCDSYDDYVQRFADQVDVDVLCMDYYPHMDPGADTRKGYCENLATMRRVSLQHNIPFWNFFNSMPFGSHTDPTRGPAPLADLHLDRLRGQGRALFLLLDAEGRGVSQGRRDHHRRRQAHATLRPWRRGSTQRSRTSAPC